MKYTTTCLIFYASTLFCSANGKVSLTVSPSKSQFFMGESLSLSCGRHGSSGGTIWRKTQSGEAARCEDYWKKLINASCHNGYTIPEDSGVYWCQCVHRHSTPVNITVTRGQVILESPALPVMEGRDVTLRCRASSPLPNQTAGFYRNGYLIRNGSTGEMRIPAVSKSDEGLYRCTISGLGESPDSWLAVQHRPKEGPSSSPVMSVTRLLCHLVVITPYVVSTIILGLIYRDQARAQRDKQQTTRDNRSDVVMEIYTVERQTVRRQKCRDGEVNV